MGETAELQRQIVFLRTGARPGEDLKPVDIAVPPALMAGYRDLTSLRYDFPVVLVESPDDGAFVRSLTSSVNDVLQEVAPRGIEGEQVRRQVLRAESEIRALVADGARGMLTDLWEKAAPDLADVSTHFKVDGEVADCDDELPQRLVEHAWRSVQRRKASESLAEVDRLIQALSDILRAAFINSEAGHRPESLRDAVGATHHDEFDFEMMSTLLGKGAPKEELPADRRERIEWALEVLRRQRFFKPSQGTELAQASESPHEYRFGSCADAVDAYRERLPEVAEFVKAMSIAELEADGRYIASEHDTFFEDFDEDSLAREDLALFPDYLVCVDADDADESAAVMEVLSSGLPVKVLVESKEILQESSPGTGHFGFGMRSAQLASTAVGLHNVFVLQATSSNLYQLRGRLLDGLEYTGPALLSVFSGLGAESSELPPYLTSAAALEGRAFPAFTYDPAAEQDGSSRYSLEENPQPELDWPLAELKYADESLQRVVEEVAFTLVDFAVCDKRHARHFARVPREHWNGHMIPVNEWLSIDPADAEEQVPYVLVIDKDDSLQRLIVDEKLMQAARHFREVWNGLQELGLERVRAETAPAAEAHEDATADVSVEASEAVKPAEATAEVSAETPEAAESTEEAVAEEQATDEAWIETARCSTCDECTEINDRMFSYNEDKQAIIKDPDAGTFRELVEAAELCQVAVIHPGKPRNPDEPDLEALIERASAFE